MTRLFFMGVPEFEDIVRCRVYGDDEVTPEDRQRAEFVNALAGDGVIECEGHERWISALQERGWLPEDGVLEPNPDGPGRIKRWHLTAKGRSEWAHMKG